MREAETFFGGRITAHILAGPLISPEQDKRQDSLRIAGDSSRCYHDAELIAMGYRVSDEDFQRVHLSSLSLLTEMDREDSLVVAVTDLASASQLAKDYKLTIVPNIGHPPLFGDDAAEGDSAGDESASRA